MNRLRRTKRLLNLKLALLRLARRGTALLKPAALGLARNPAGALFAACLLGLGVGLSWERPSLGLAVPCGWVALCMTWARLRGR